MLTMTWWFCVDGDLVVLCSRCRLGGFVLTVTWWFCVDGDLVVLC